MILIWWNRFSILGGWVLTRFHGLQWINIWHFPLVLLQKGVFTDRNNRKPGNYCSHCRKWRSWLSVILYLCVSVSCLFMLVMKRYGSSLMFMSYFMLIFTPPPSFSWILLTENCACSGWFLLCSPYKNLYCLSIIEFKCQLNVTMI